jgi:spore germination protein YaaH
LKRLLIFICLLCLALPSFALPYESLTYLYGGTSPVYQNNIARTRGNLSTVVLDYFEIDANGNAILSPWKKPDTLLIQALQKQGIRVIAYVSNHFDREVGRRAMTRRAAVTTALAGWVEQYGLDGLDVDIENLTHADKDNFTDFVRLLSTKMPKNKRLSAAVAANPYRLTTGWHGQYDYAALGRLCNAVMLMTYDQSYDGSPAGPVASLKFTEDAVKEALRHIPKDKLIMGIPFYGRYWAALNSGGTVRGRAFTVSDIDTITGIYPSRKWYDAVNHCARASVTVRRGDPSFRLWGGRTIDPARDAGVYDIWYENEQSYATRMELCRKYDLLGVGSWALGQEPERIWRGYRLWLGGVPFSDLAGHWAEEAMAELFELGIITGVGEARCEPDRAVSRAEVCVMLCRLLNIAPRTPPSSAPAEIRRHWAAPYLWSASQLGLLEGDGGVYRPSDLVNRAELALFCVRGLHVTRALDFNQRFYPDVAPPAWYNEAAVTMRVYGVMTGMPDGSFRPYAGATRAEAATVIYRMLENELKDFSPQSRSRAPQPRQYIIDPR